MSTPALPFANTTAASAPPLPHWPLAFARRHGVLLRGLSNGLAQLTVRPDVSALSLAEARRHLGVPLALEKVTTERFDQLLREAYEAGTDARTAAGGLEETTDLAFLAQDLPEQADTTGCCAAGRAARVNVGGGRT